MGRAAAYRRLPPASRRAAGGGGGRGGVRVRPWVLLRRVAAQLYAARRLTWAALCGRVAGAGTAVAAAAAAPRRGAVGPYDSASYARNFDDGVWKAEEGVFWSTGSFACRFAHRAAADAAPPAASGGDPAPSSSIH